MAPPGDVASRHAAAIAALGAWLAPRVASGRDADAANALILATEEGPAPRSVADLAGRVGISSRTAQRLASEWIGLPPSFLIRRRRLQDAAARLRAEPEVDLARVAHDSGYADHAHFTRDFAATIGMAPRDYRRALAADRTTPQP
jgi:AraC-like DNA-binding protein